MDLLTIFVYLCSAVILFFILNYFDQKEKENNLIHALIPAVYEILLAGIFSGFGWQYMNYNLYFIVIFELFLRLGYIKNILKREDLLNSSFYVQIYGISILSCYFINRGFISQVESVFPTAEEMRVGIWFLIIIFLYFILKNHVHVQYKEQTSTFGGKKQEYILVQYARLKNLYFKEVKEKNKEYIPMIYAMMIYENYKKPVFRKLDALSYRFTGREKKFGIMQISSKTEIDDKTSIKLAIKKIDKIIENLSKKVKKDQVIEVLNEYYDNDQIVSQVMEIYQKIKEFDAI